MKYIKIILIFIASLILYGCESDSFYSSDSASDQGTAGSLARFAITGNYLYTVEYEQLKIFDISNEQTPVFIDQINPGFDIETIFPVGNYLFLGSRWGVYIYDITNPVSPNLLSQYTHIYSCDPVVVSGNYAYSTLNSSGPCGRGVNQLEVIDISNILYPVNVHTIVMDNPKGLGISNDFLFVCDNGIKVFDISNPDVPIFIRKESVDAFDVIPIDNILIVVANSGLYQYELNLNGELSLLSTLFTKI